MSGNDKRLVEFEKLNLVGKVIFISGTTFRFVGDLLESVAETVVGIITETERAFIEGADPNVDDANIVETFDNESSGGKSSDKDVPLQSEKKG